MNKVKRIGTRDTLRGLAVGLTVISDITNDGRNSKIDFCATLSAYDAEDEVETIYSVLSGQGQNIVRINKRDLSEFEAFIAKYEDAFYTEIELELLRKNIKVLTEQFKKLSKSPKGDEDVAALLGYSRGDARKWLADPNAVIRNSGADLKERIEALAYVLHGLMLHFENEPNEQQAWLYTKRADLGRKRPWDVLTSGSLTDVYQITSLVNRVIG
jgi:hypothetical protein